MTDATLKWTQFLSKKVVDTPVIMKNRGIQTKETKVKWFYRNLLASFCFNARIWSEKMRIKAWCRDNCYYESKRIELTYKIRLIFNLILLSATFFMCCCIVWFCLQVATDERNDTKKDYETTGILLRFSNINWRPDMGALWRKQCLFFSVEMKIKNVQINIQTIEFCMQIIV